VHYEQTVRSGGGGGGGGEDSERYGFRSGAGALGVDLGDRSASSGVSSSHPPTSSTIDEGGGVLYEQTDRVDEDGSTLPTSTSTSTSTSTTIPILSHYQRNPQPWCHVWRPFPSVYAYVQDHYWNVGFLRYYTPQQIPNFLLASPVLGASAYTAVHYVRTLGIKAASAERIKEGSLYGTRARPHLAMFLTMAAGAAVVMHVQVATRFLSVCPALYWAAASEGRRLGPEVQRWICIYSVAFGLLGTLMFPTFYPWT